MYPNALYFHRNCYSEWKWSHSKDFHFESVMDARDVPSYGCLCYYPSSNLDSVRCLVKVEESIFRVACREISTEDLDDVRLKRKIQ